MLLMTENINRLGSKYTIVKLIYLKQETLHDRTICWSQVIPINRDFTVCKINIKVNLSNKIILCIINCYVFKIKLIILNK